MSFVHFEQELFYCRQLRDLIDVGIEISNEDLGISWWLFDKLYTNLNLMHGSTHQTRALGFKVRQRKAVYDPLGAGWHNLVTFSAPLKDRYYDYATVLLFW